MQLFKLLRSFNLVFLFAYILLNGCGKTDTAVSTPMPSCYDNIKNQGELDVDCGGPCPNCQAKMTAKINGSSWESQGNVTSMINGNAIIILSGNGTSNLSLIYTGPFIVGTFPLQSANYSITVPSSNYITNTGTISFLEWDDVKKVVSGNFHFNAFESSGTGDTVHVTEGKFLFVPYQP